jgi:hypothetical protein
VNRKTLCVLVAAGLFVPLAARGQATAAPSPEEVKKVADYYNTGKDAGPILAEIKPCLKVDATKGSATFLDCVEPVTGKVKKGVLVNAWMSFLVPKDAKYEDLSLQWLLDGTVRTTQDLTLKFPGTSARTYMATTANKPGKWEVKVLRDGKELGSAKFEVE